MRSPIKNTESLEFGGILGEGKYGKVIAARNKKTTLSTIMGKMKKQPCEQPYTYAVKYLRSEEDAQREAAVLFKCTHEHVIECVAIGKGGKGPMDCIITTACYGSIAGRMGPAMHVHGGVLERGLVCKWTLQVLSALAHLHSLDIVHRDVTTSNIFFKTGEVECDVVLAGFGSAAPLSTLEDAGPVGTCEYFAPELADGVAQGPYTDVWAVGMCLYWMVTFRKPPILGAGFTARRAIQSYPQFQQARAENLLLRLCQSFKERPSAQCLVSTADADFENPEIQPGDAGCFRPRKRGLFPIPETRAVSEPATRAVCVVADTVCSGTSTQAGMCTLRMPRLLGVGFSPKRMIQKYPQFEQARAEYLLLRMCQQGFRERPSAQALVREFAFMDLVTESTVNTDFEPLEDPLGAFANAFPPKAMRAA